LCKCMYNPTKRFECSDLNSPLCSNSGDFTVDLKYLHGVTPYSPFFRRSQYKRQLLALRNLARNRNTSICVEFRPLVKYGPNDHDVIHSGFNNDLFIHEKKQVVTYVASLNVIFFKFGVIS
jgi:hypothetical protein